MVWQEVVFAVEYYGFAHGKVSLRRIKTFVEEAGEDFDVEMLLNKLNGMNWRSSRCPEVLQ